MDLSRLNAPQKSAVLHKNGPLLILAGAGSGKTSTMTYRIAHLMSQHGIPGSRILGLSFTNKAANELKERVTKLVTQTIGPTAARGLTLTTFHRLCVQLLRQSADKIGHHKNFTILDSNDQLDILRTILRRIKIDDRKFDVYRILGEFSRIKNQFWTPDQAEAYFYEATRIGSLPADYATACAASFRPYIETLRSQQAMDFDDLLYYAALLLHESEEVRTAASHRFQYILVDEYQDTNSLQFKILKSLTSTHQNICVVGDDDQSIYSWRGADPTHILAFDSYFPGSKLITLDQNYRSTMTILGAANQVISGNKKRHPKSLWSNQGQGEKLEEMIAEDDRAEAEMVADEIVASRGNAPWSSIAVLYRSNTQSRLFEEAFHLRRIPYQLVGSYSFLDRKEVKDVLAYWRLIVNPSDDVSCRRILNWPTRGLGKTALEVLNTLSVQSGRPMTDLLANAVIVPDLKEKARNSAADLSSKLVQLRTELESAPNEPEALATWAKKSLTVLEVKRGISDDSDDPLQIERRLEIVEDLCHMMGQLRKEELQENALETVRHYLNHLLLESLDTEKDKEDDQPKDAVILMTLHGSKGLEFPTVYLVGMEDGILPHQKTIDEGKDLSEERRLCYVGMTRAKTRLVLTRAKFRIKYGKKVPRLPSRFMAEIPPELIEKRDTTIAPTGDALRSILGDLKKSLQI